MKKGFTLIELLAVMVILAIIALISVPIVLNIIDETKVSAVKRSSELYLSAVDLAIAKTSMDQQTLNDCNFKKDKIICNEKEYLIEIDGIYPTFLEINVNENEKIDAAFEYDGYCVIKKDDKITYKKIVENVIDESIEIIEEECTIMPKEYTSEKCFAFNATTGTITSYYNYEENDSTKNVCPKDVVIPKNIGGVEVTKLGFESLCCRSLTSVEIPNTVITIDAWAFYDNKLTNLKIPEGVKTIGRLAFKNNEIQNLELPNTISFIDVYAFSSNKLSQEQAYIYKRNSNGTVDYSTIIGYGGESKDIIIPSEKNGIKLTTIGQEAFHGIGLTSVKIPNTVTKISKWGLSGNSLTKIEIPSSVTIVDYQAFNNNPLISVYIDNLQENITLGANAFGTFSDIKYKDSE